MSLRIFHILFITLSTLLSLGLAAWAYGNFRAYGATGHLIASGIAAAVALALVVYGVWFLRKSRKLIL
jgi:hypothetical protein